MAGQRKESTVGQGTLESDPNLREIIWLVGCIANALEYSQNNQQHSQVDGSYQVRSAIATDDLTLLERFVKLEPIVFVGFWWKTIDAKWTADNVIRTCDLFTTEFNNKYISTSVRRDREMDFLQLEQKNKTLQEYEKEFTALARHAYYLVEGYDWKCRKFETGLNPNIQEVIAPLNISDYHYIIDWALNIERTLGFTWANRIWDKNLHEIHQMYETSFWTLSDRHFKDTPWSAVDVVVPYIDNNHVFYLLYSEWRPTAVRNCHGSTAVGVAIEVAFGPVRMIPSGGRGGQQWCL
ncbi:hypothetical protein RJ640_019554 [Escallonia rubra]|uniref:Retrotransposon gag domain-containing protein n=1 Tax=Escallonia rubra TaxID=112253 RepID=A0AA88UFH9_9ASTE|nr:hypothetical protein RJ640_019554 [Escallonia rubra]